MDSLRSRDYTYPLAIPEYEMSVSGQADKFFSFIKNELYTILTLGIRLTQLIVYYWDTH